MDAMILRNGDMSFELMIVTPDMARSWLESNTGNRSVRKQAVRRLAGVMETGGFGLTHQGIAFDDTGRLVDGQHRLMAIAESGVPATLLVCRGLPRSRVGMVDDRVGGTRSICDHMRYQGVEANNKQVAIARIMMLHAFAQRRGAADGDYRWGFNVRLPAETWARFYTDVAPAIEFGVSVVSTNSKLAHAAVAAAAATAWYTKSFRSRLTEFGEVMATGSVRSPEDVAAIKLRDFLLTTGLRAGGEDARRVIFLRACTAMRAFIESRPITRLTTRDDATFTIPFFSYL
jgi:imidazolonepropionase-like amidohydrolase